VGKKGVEVVRGVQGHWVRGEDGRLITHVSRQKIPLFLCSLFSRKGVDVDEDFARYIDLRNRLERETKPAVVTPDTEIRYCFSADPSGSVFLGTAFVNFGRLGFGRWRCATEHGVWTASGDGDELHEGHLYGALLGLCRGEVVVAAWGEDAKTQSSDRLRLRFMQPESFKSGEPKVVKEMEVRQALLRRPVELVDLDPSCGCLLLAKPSAEDGAARWYVLEIGTGRYQRVHHGPGYGLFLGEELGL
jgi:hypothetical protein